MKKYWLWPVGTCILAVIIIYGLISAREPWSNALFMGTFVSFVGLLIYEAYLSEQITKHNLTDAEIQKRKMTSFDMALIMFVFSAACSSYCVILFIQGHKLDGEDFFGLFTYLSLMAVVWSGNRLWSLFRECFAKPTRKILEFVLLDLIILAVVVALAHYFSLGPPLTFVGALALLLAFLKGGSYENEHDENKATNYGANAMVLNSWAIIENFTSLWAVQTKSNLLEGVFLVLMLSSFGFCLFSFPMYFFRKNRLVKIKLKKLLIWLFLLGLGYWFLVWLNSYFKIISIKTF